MLALLAIVTHAHAATCSSPTSQSDVTDAVFQAYDAYGRRDLDAFAVAVNFLDRNVLCVLDPLGRDAAADIHGIHALRAFTQDNDAAVVAEFSAARALRTTFALPDGTVPDGNRVLDLLASAGPVTRTTVATPRVGRLYFDGIETDERPNNVPTLLQMLGGDNVVSETEFLDVGMPMPYYPERIEAKAPPVTTSTPVAPTPVARVDPRVAQEAAKKKRHGSGVSMTVGGAVLLAAAAGAETWYLTTCDANGDGATDAICADGTNAPIVLGVNLGTIALAGLGAAYTTVGIVFLATPNGGTAAGKGTF